MLKVGDKVILRTLNSKHYSDYLIRDFNLRKYFNKIYEIDYYHKDSKDLPYRLYVEELNSILI
ncbi:MAG: hypothetical protein ABSG25_07130 [Bryobacteraceae bacterium]